MSSAWDKGVCDGRVVTYFVLGEDWQDNGKMRSKGGRGGREKWSLPRGLSFMAYRIIME